MHKKVIVLTLNKVFFNSLKSGFLKDDYEIVRGKGLELISDLNIMKKSIRLFKNTAGIRKHYTKFVTENGTPLAFIIDFPLDLKLGENDPDNDKLLKTFIIADIILSKSAGFSWYETNIFLLGSKRDSHILNSYAKNPCVYMENVLTQNENLNRLIQFYIDDPDACSNIFKIEPIIMGDAKQDAANIDHITEMLRKIYNRRLQQERTGQV
ncbi:MAG: hypothetical protein KAS39_08090, partial [Actinomycetia bacterium]|nr:hypothetical protein [Actinomycetes bacterium]